MLSAINGAPPSTPGNCLVSLVLLLFWKVQSEISDCCTNIILTTALPLCPHEMKAIALMCSSLMLVNTNPAGQVHTIQEVVSGREAEFP